jgi:ABC-type Zn2+ transport system substrate-binding protein/surface adhesin
MFMKALLAVVLIAFASFTLSACRFGGNKAAEETPPAVQPAEQNEMYEQEQEHDHGHEGDHGHDHDHGGEE